MAAPRSEPRATRGHDDQIDTDGLNDGAGRIRLAARTPVTAKRHENRAGGVEVRATVGWLAKAAQH